MQPSGIVVPLGTKDSHSLALRTPAQSGSVVHIAVLSPYGVLFCWIWQRCPKSVPLQVIRGMYLQERWHVAGRKPPPLPAAAFETSTHPFVQGGAMPSQDVHSPPEGTAADAIQKQPTSAVLGSQDACVSRPSQRSAAHKLESLTQPQKTLLSHCGCVRMAPHCAAPPPTPVDCAEMNVAMVVVVAAVSTTRSSAIDDACTGSAKKCETKMRILCGFSLRAV